MVKGQKYHMLYKTTCTVTGNFYVGVHSTTNLEDDYLGSGIRLSRSIEKHGIENHVREVLELLETREDLMKREREVVNEEMLRDPKCMNLKAGGEGGLHLLDSEALSKIRKGASDWLKNQRSNPSFVETQRRVSSSRLKKLHQEGVFKAPNWKGKKHSESTLKKFRETRKNLGKGEKNSMHGRIWVFNEKERKSMPIEKALLENMLISGWKIGRKKWE